MSKMSRTIDKLQSLIDAFEFCVNDLRSCDGCPYDGLCDTYPFKWEEDSSAVLADSLGLFDYGRGEYKALCDDIRGSYLQLCEWLHMSKKGVFVDKNGNLIFKVDDEIPIVDLMKRIKKELEEKSE